MHAFSMKQKTSKHLLRLESRRMKHLPVEKLSNNSVGDCANSFLFWRANGKLELFCLKT